MKKDNFNNKSENEFDLFEHIFILFELTSKYYIKMYEKYNINQVQFQILYLLYKNKSKGIKMSELGDNLEIAKSGITILIDKMTLEGLVKRCSNGQDRRIINIILTEKGACIIKKIFQSNEIFKVNLLDFMQQDENEILCKLIIKIKEQLEGIQI